MPTLQPQTVSGLVVIPTVELDGLIYRVSLGIDVGMTRAGSPAPATIAREDLIVEIRNASEGSFEPVASPDPGPLPVHALRVVQARGEFTFGRGVNPPDELVVTVRGDRRSFPMAQTFPTGGGFSQEPREGRPFPGRFPKPWPILLRRGCCVERFEVDHGGRPRAVPENLAPVSGAVGGGGGSPGSYEVGASFASNPPRCNCGCCQYRQFVRGAFTDGSGAAVRFDLPAGPLDPSLYREDGAIDEFGQGRHGFYGHRDTSSPGDQYGAKGCTYVGSEAASCPAGESAHLEFLGLVVDTCRGTLVAKRSWTVDL